MTLRALVPLALLCLPACYATRAKAQPAAETPGEVLSYRATVADVPAGASSLVLRLRLPEVEHDGGLVALRACVLVGNAALELPLERAGSLEREHATLSWAVLEEGGVQARELCIETRGKPIELMLRLARPLTATGATDGLERTLALGTSASVDGKPLESVRTRLERVR